MIRVALLSKWHVHATDYAKEAIENPDISIEMIWDEDTRRGARWAEELGTTFEEELTTVLSNPEIDAVIVSAPTNKHKDIILEAASYQKHIFTEKVLAFSTEDCEEIFESVDRNQVQLMVSLPRLTEDYYLLAQQMVNDGALGTLTMMRCRVAHDGAVPTEKHPTGWLPSRFFDQEECGGGALIDLGAHPIYLANRLLGTPTAVTGRLESMMNLGVDDHSVALVEYRSGVLAVLETSFISKGSPFQLELYGTEGTLLIEDNQVRFKASGYHKEEWVLVEDLPSPLPMPMEQWCRAIQDGTAPSIKNIDAKQLTLINEAAIQSHQEGRRINLQ